MGTFEAEKMLPIIVEDSVPEFSLAMAVEPPQDAGLDALAELLLDFVDHPELTIDPASQEMTSDANSN